MKALFIFLVCTFLSLEFSAQIKTKKIYNDLDRWGAKEVYHVMKKDKKVRHGSYRRYFRNGNIHVVGQFTKGKKDSLWVTYDRTSQLPLKKGIYKEGEKVGVWEYCDFDGVLQQRYDHSLSQLIWLHDDFKDNVQMVWYDGEFQEATVDREVVFIGGGAELSTYQFPVEYPMEAKENGISGEVVIEFQIDEDGKASGHRIVKEPAPILGRPVLEMTRGIPDLWLPALVDGEPVKSIKLMPFRFILQ